MISSMSARGEHRRLPLLWGLALATLIVAGCGGKAERIDVDEDLGLTTGVGSQDFRSVCYQMTQSLVQLPQVQRADNPPKIAFTEVKNNSDELMDMDDFLYKMRTELIKNAQGKLLFLDRDIAQAMMEEKLLKESGEMSGSTGKMMGADYFLSGRVESISGARGREQTKYMRFSFRLSQASTGAIIWEDDYEMKKYQKAGIYDR